MALPPPSLEERVRNFLMCRRCLCNSCIDGYDNHDHNCTHRKGCIESPEAMRRYDNIARELISDLRAALLSRFDNDEMFRLALIGKSVEVAKENK